MKYPTMKPAPQLPRNHQTRLRLNSSITLTSRDGASIEYSSEVIEEPATLLVFEVNGRTQWENGIEIVQVVAGNQPEELWLWNLKTLTVNP